jgi:GT2 family glycosyltransferase
VTHAVETTVVVPAYRAAATLPSVLDALAPQVVGRAREAIVVESSSELPELERRWPWVRVLRPAERMPPGRARNLGAREAAGALVAFLDADAVPEPDWLDELERALEPGVDAVAGAILNGTPRSAVGTAGYLLEFSEWLPRRRGVPGHGATCNLLVRRSALADAGGFPEDLWPGEDTVLTFRLAEAGRLAFAAQSRVRHLNRTRLREFLAHQRRLGASFLVVCRTVDFPYAWIVRPRLAPLAAVLRIWALAKRVSASPDDAARALAVLPVVLVGLAAWGAGLAGENRPR